MAAASSGRPPLVPTLALDAPRAFLVPANGAGKTRAALALIERRLRQVPPQDATVLVLASERTTEIPAWRTWAQTHGFRCRVMTAGSNPSLLQIHLRPAAHATPQTKASR